MVTTKWVGFEFSVWATILRQYSNCKLEDRTSYFNILSSVVRKTNQVALECILGPALLVISREARAVDLFFHCFVVVAVIVTWLGAVPGLVHPTLGISILHLRSEYNDWLSLSISKEH